MNKYTYKLQKKKIKKGESQYHFVEVMACPGGCVGGGVGGRGGCDKVGVREGLGGRSWRDPARGGGGRVVVGGRLGVVDGGSGRCGDCGGCGDSGGCGACGVSGVSGVSGVRVYVM